MKFIMTGMWKIDMTVHAIPFTDMVYDMWKTRAPRPFYYFFMRFS